MGEPIGRLECFANVAATKVRNIVACHAFSWNYLEQWFLTGGASINFWGPEPLCTLQHGKFDQQIYQ